MDITEKYIVAIDLGTSKIALTVAKVNGKDVQIVYYKETPSNGIRYSSVFNESAVTRILSAAIREAEDELGIKITSAVVGMPKYPVIQVSNTAKMEDRGEDCDIAYEDIAELKTFAEQSYPLDDPQKYMVYGAVAQSFSDGENFQIIENDIIGMTGDTLEGNFKIFIGNRRSLNKIDHVMNRIGISAIRKYFTADSTAKAVLTNAEMENGVALVEFGGGCTSVSIYYGNIMRHYASIPFGGKNISDDIKSECQISDTLAENIKLGFGACMPEKLQNLSEKIIHIRSNSADPDKQLPVKYLSEVITARVGEIMNAILYVIEKSGFADKIRSGIVVTGGVAQTANLCNYIYDISGYKIRTGYPRGPFSCQGCDGITETSASTSVGLILTALEESSINCAINSDDIATSVVVEQPETPEHKEATKEAVEDEQQTDAPEEVTEEKDFNNNNGTLLEFETVKPEKKETPKRRGRFSWLKKNVAEENDNSDDDGPFKKFKQAVLNLYDSSCDETPQA